MNYMSSVSHPNKKSLEANRREDERINRVGNSAGYFLHIAVRLMCLGERTKVGVNGVESAHRILARSCGISGYPASDNSESR